METGVEEFLDLKTSGKLGSSALRHGNYCDDCRSLNRLLQYPSSQYLQNTTNL